MTSRPFQIAVEGCRLHATLLGYWDLATAEDYVAELLKAAKTVAPPQPYWLMDFSAFPVQSAEVADRLTHGVGKAKRVIRPIVAIVGISTLGALQGRRVAQAGPQIRFTTVAEADAWLSRQMAACVTASTLDVLVAVP